MRTLRGSWAHLHPSRVILTFLMFMITGTMLGALLGMLLFPPDALRWIQAMNTIFTFLVPAWIMAYLVDEKPGDTMGRRNTLVPGTPIIAAGMMAMALPFIGFVTEWMSSLPVPEALSFLEQLKEQTEAVFAALLSMGSFWDLTAAVLVMAFLPAWAEEAFFRGILFGQLKRRLRNPHATVWFTALFFAAVHLQWEQFPAILLLGGVLGYLRLYTGGIWVPAIAHFTNNAIAVFMAYALIQKGKDPIRDPLYPIDFPIWMALLSAAIVIVGIVFVKRLAAERQA